MGHPWPSCGDVPRWPPSSASRGPSASVGSGRHFAREAPFVPLRISYAAWLDYLPAVGSNALAEYSVSPGSSLEWLTGRAFRGLSNCSRLTGAEHSSCELRESML